MRKRKIEKEEVEELIKVYETLAEKALETFKENIEVGKQQKEYWIESIEILKGIIKGKERVEVEEILEEICKAIGEAEGKEKEEEKEECKRRAFILIILIENRNKGLNSPIHTKYRGIKVSINLYNELINTKSHKKYPKAEEYKRRYIEKVVIQEDWIDKEWIIK